MHFISITPIPLLSTGVQLTLEVQKDCGPTVREFKAKVDSDEGVKAKVTALRQEVETFALQFPLPGHADL